MVLAIHGATGGWDEIAIAMVAFIVLWVAVKLAGRKPAETDQDDEDEGVAAPRSTVEVDQPHRDPAPPAAPLG